MPIDPIDRSIVVVVFTKSLRAHLRLVVAGAEASIALARSRKAEDRAERARKRRQAEARAERARKDRDKLASERQAGDRAERARKRSRR